MSALGKLNKQNEQTWINLQKRLNEVQFPYEELFSEETVYNFIKYKAISVGSCEGYFIPSLITTTAYLLSCNDAKVNVTTHNQPLNLYTIFIGYPGTGKSSAIRYAATDLLEGSEFGESIISKTTSSGLVKLISANKKGIILSPEVFDVLNKLMKSDEENGTGDVQLLCKLFSGESSTYHFSTENARVIKAETPFCILGSTQLTNAAKLIARMDHGHGLVDRILLATPLAYRPTLTQMEEAKTQVTTERVSDFGELSERLSALDRDTVYKFDANGQRLLRETIDNFSKEVNDDLAAGRVPPKSKNPELIPRLATSLHVLNHVLAEMLFTEDASEPPSTIPCETLQHAINFVKHLESQKQILCQFLKQITDTVCDKTVEQPTLENVKAVVLTSQGPAVTYRSFKHGKRAARSIAEPEYNKAVQSLQEDGFGRQISFRVPRATTICKVFIKEKPSSWPSTSSVDEDQFQEALRKPLHKDITQAMRDYMNSNNYI